MKRPGLHAATHSHVTSLADLPETVLHQILSQLSARDLAALSVQGKYLRLVAADSALWGPLALARWPGADAELHYEGDWHRLYTSRAPMPHAFPLAADRVRVVTAFQQQPQHAASAATGPAAAAGSSSRAGSLPSLAFEDIMQQVFNACLAVSKDRSMRRTAEWRGLKQDLIWWATHRPEVIVAFVRSTHEALHSGWGAPSRSTVDTPWRRSAVAFLQDLGLLTGAHASLLNRIASEAAALDRAMCGAQSGSHSAQPAPEGIPASHWWFS